MTEQNERDAATDFQSPNPLGIDARLEADITIARMHMESSLDAAKVHRDVARAFEKQMARLIAQRSPAQIARMEKEQGLSC